ncbi:Uncharacterised protein [BD1-7 clade bacterium]|nr:Uncharacterised protein [BD1-7 clade bacterium]
MANLTISLRYLLAACLLLITGLSASLQAQTASQFETDWAPWVEEKHPNLDCPWLASASGKSAPRSCLWPEQLSMSLLNNGLNFHYTFETFSDEALVYLPGNHKHWPQAVQLNVLSGSAASRRTTSPLLDVNGKPALHVAKGRYQVSGQFRWQQQPASLMVPANIALLALTRGKQSQTINRHGDQLVLGRAETQQKQVERNRLNVQVFRKLDDGVPLMMTTALKLSVSGSAREVDLGRLLPANSEVIRIDSRLPARVDANGNIRVQLKPGEYTLWVTARFTNNPTTVGMQAESKHWPKDEYISFVPNTDIRQVALSGATAVDTSLIDIPGGWRNLATYRLTPDTPLKITTEERGDSHPRANQLAFQRNLWLDFDGKGMTVLDDIGGQMFQGWRLNAGEGMQVGRATVAGNPVLITDDKGQQGIEIRSPDVAVQAVSRLENPREFSAIGWHTDADSYESTLHLPPGWRVLMVNGVDSAEGSWLTHWNLWSIFLVLILVAATYQLMGIKVALLAAVMLVISFHEPDTPLWVWPPLLLIIALLPLVKGTWHRLFSVAGGLCAVALVILTVSFAIDNFRLAIYPSLERSQVGHYGGSMSGYQAGEAMHFAEPELADAERQVRSTQRMKKSMTSLSALGDENTVTQAPRKKAFNPYQLTENDRVQTGPGLPTWTWNRLYLNTSGPVMANQQIDIVYSAPWLTRLWLVASVLLIAAFGVIVLQRLAAVVKPSESDIPSTTTASAIAALILPLIFVSTAITSSSSAYADEYPPKHLMTELEQRLTKKPVCLPHCVGFDNGRLTANKNRFSLRFDAYADAAVAAPLPKGDWQLTRVLVDGKPASVQSKNGQLLIRLDKGRHAIEMQAKTQADQVTVNFSQPVHNFVAQAEHWQIDGLIDQRMPNNSLSLTARAKTQQANETTLKPAPVEAFVLVHRTLTLGQQWRLETHVQRLAPNQGAITVRVPLWPEEQVLSDVPIDNGHVTIQLKANQSSAHWRSSLKPVEQLTLEAKAQKHFLETWRVEPSSLWRVDYQGLPPVKEADSVSTLRPLWKPWPGDKLALAMSRPAGIKGPTRTVEKASLHYTAGKQLQKSELRLDVRASQGGFYPIGLPENAKVLSLRVNGKSLNVPTESSIRVPLQPGLQEVEVSFQQAVALPWWSTTPAIQLPEQATNISLSYELPKDRWALYLQGPPIGPAMLYWGVLLVIILAAIALNTLTRKLQLNIPVSLFDWLLLGIGLSTVNGFGIFWIAAFFFICAWRYQRVQPESMPRLAFNSLQIFLVFGAVVSAMILVGAIPLGLLSSPDMKVVGNGSYAGYFSWYQDRAAGSDFPTADVFSVPLFAYRVVMLLWALWIASRLLAWAKWVWSAFTEERVWTDLPKKESTVNMAESQPVAAPDAEFDAEVQSADKPDEGDSKAP